MTLSTGTRLGPYELLAPVGAGGMGEVYRAKDTRLDRTVAVKVLPAHLSSSTESRQRFEREAKTISQLSHPHICALYDVGNQDGVEFLVMEYLEGETLSDRLLKGPLAFDQVLRFGIEIADALDKAHRQGIVHRDLKPGNVMLTKSGVKLLDFGLAKAMTSERSLDATGREQKAAAQHPMVERNLTALPTVAGNLTQAGTILGTFQYMAPEQLEGKEADARTDIFAFGCVLYEMATGKKAFSGKSQASLISSIMGSQPPAVSAIALMTPPAFDRVVRTCLAKDPEDRWQTAHDVMLELKWVAEGGSAAGLPAPFVAKRRNRERIAWVAAAAFAVLAAVAGLGNLRRSPAPRLPVRASILAAPGTIFNPIDGPVALSRDGRRMAFAAVDLDGSGWLWVRSLDSGEAVKLADTRDPYDPFWSPDGRFVGYGVQAGLFKFEVPAGPAQKIADMADGRGCAWNRENVILFEKTGASPIFRVSASGGAVEQVTTLDKSRGETAHWRPQFLPDGKHFLYFARAEPSQNSGIYVGTLGSKERTRVLDLEVPAAYAEPGYLLFIRENVLMAQPFDLQAFRVSGEPAAVGRNVQYVATWGSSAFATSDNGVLVYQGPSPVSRQLVWFDRSGRRVATLGPETEYSDDPRISPDGSRVAVKRVDPTTRSADIWIYDVSRNVGSRFTFDAARESDPVWSADGTRLFFSSNKAGIGNLYVKPSSGAGSEELLLKSDHWKEPLDVSPDGRWLAFGVGDPRTKLDIWLLSLSGDRKATPLIATPFQEGEPRFSPDGRWLAYTTEETGKSEVVVQPFPPTGEKWQVSTNGGRSPRWTSGGNELVYFEPPEMRKIVSIRRSPSFQVSAPKDLFATPNPQGSDVSRDGQRMLLNLRVAETAPSPMTLVLDWTSGLRK
jgi:Tol biopolymer transport system component/predicted Ser/Thr protein kinase